MIIRSQNASYASAKLCCVGGKERPLSLTQLKPLLQLVIQVQLWVVECQGNKQVVDRELWASGGAVS